MSEAGKGQTNAFGRRKSNTQITAELAQLTGVFSKGKWRSDMTTTHQNSPIQRTSAGLRDVLFDELDALRNGDSNPTRANAVAKLSSSVVETVRMELDVQKHVHSLGGGEKSPLPSSSPLGSPLKLSGE